MVDVTQSSQYILGTMLDWLSIAVVFCIIYMLFRLATGGKGFSGLGNLFSGDDSNPRENRKDRPDAPDTPDGGKGNGPESTKKEWPDWADGLGTVSVWVTDEDNNPIQGARVKIKHRKLKDMEKKMGGYTGTNGTYGPKEIPAGQIMVKATHRNFFQYAITLGLGGAGLLANPLIGGVMLLGSAIGTGLLSSDRYAFKDWYFLKKDSEQTFHIRLKRKKGQRDHAFEPKIYDVILNDQNPKGERASRLRGKID